MANSGFDYHEFTVYTKKLKIASDTFQKFLEGFLLQMGYRVLARGQPKTPVDTGALKRSWKVSNVEVHGTTLTVTISLNMEYASHVEYGHHSYPAQYMLSISIDEIRQQIPARFKKEFNMWLKSLGFDEKG